MSNKSDGNEFENEVAETLSNEGYWVHLNTQNTDGQPSDIIAVKNGFAYLIDAKVCSTDKGFVFTRIEENQRLAMDLWFKTGNGTGWFALKVDNEIRMIPIIMILAYEEQGVKSFKPGEIKTLGTPIERWMARCKQK